MAPRRRRVKPKPVPFRVSPALLRQGFIPGVHPITTPIAQPASSGGVGTITRPIPTDTSATHGVVVPAGTSGSATVNVQHSGPAGAVQDFVQQTLPAWLKIAGGGIVVVVSGLALVYVAGRNTAPVAATKEAVKVATPVGRAAGAVGAAVPKGVRKARTGSSERRDAKFYRQAYENTDEYRAGAGEARRAKVLPRTKGLGDPSRGRGPRR